MTFIEYHRERWWKDPERETLRIVANRIAWNIWQMDGHKDAVPLGRPYERFHQMTLAEILSDLPQTQEEETQGILCKIYDWRRDNSIQFRKLKESCKMGKKLFAYVIGNPPYQKPDSTSEAGFNGKPDGEGSNT